MWSQDVSDELSFNEQGLKAVFQKCELASDAKPGRVSLAAWKTFCSELGPTVSVTIANRCFAESSITTLNELDPSVAELMESLDYFEMLDAVVRLAVLLFEKSQMAELSTPEKLRYLMDPLLRLVDLKRVIPEVNDMAPVSESEDESVDGGDPEVDNHCDDQS